MVPAMMEELLFDDILYGNRAPRGASPLPAGSRLRRRRGPRDPGPARGGPPGPRAAGRDPRRSRQDARLGPDMDYRLRDLSAEQLASALITGIEKPAPEMARAASELYWLPPIPNYFFQRDPLVVVGRARGPRLDGDARPACASPCSRATSSRSIRGSRTRRAGSSGSRSSRRTTPSRPRTRGCGPRSRGETSSCSARTCSRSATRSARRKRRSSGWRSP